MEDSPSTPNGLKGVQIPSDIIQHPYSSNISSFEQKHVINKAQRENSNNQLFCEKKISFQFAYFN